MERVRQCLRRVGRRSTSLFAALLAAFGVATLATPAQAQVTLPDLGLDFSEVVDAVATGVGPYIAAVILFAGAVLCITLGMKWMKRFVS